MIIRLYRYVSWDIRILKARNEVSNNETIFSVQQFKVPEINVMADNYTELRHWEADHQQTKLPIAKSVSTEELVACTNDEKTLDRELFDFPCHTQSDERCIKLVTKAIHESARKRETRWFYSGYNRTASKNASTRIQKRL